MCPKSHYVFPANIRAHASVPGRLARAPRQRGALAFWCGGDGAVSLKRRSYCDLLCGASARACLAEAGDPAAFRKLWDFAVTCAHRPTTHAADVDIREFFLLSGWSKETSLEVISRRKNAVFHAVGSEGRRSSIRVAWHGSLTRSCFFFFFFRLRMISLRFCESRTCRGYELGRQDSNRFSSTWRSPLLQKKGKGTTRLNVMIGAAAETPAMALPRRWSMCKMLSVSNTLRLLRTRNGVPTKRCQHVLNGVAPSYGTMLCSRPWYLHGRTENVHNEADEVIAQVRSRTLSIEKWRRSNLLPNRYVFIKRCFVGYANTRRVKR